MKVTIKVVAIGLHVQLQIANRSRRQSQVILVKVHLIVIRAEDAVFCE